MRKDLMNTSGLFTGSFAEALEEEMLTVDEIKEKLIRTEKGKVKQTISNCMLVLRYDPILKKSICRNELTCKTDIIGNMPWKRRGINLTNTDENNVKYYLEKNYELTSERNIRTALDIIANENSYHPIRSYLEKLKWDGEERIRFALNRFLGAEMNEYTYEVLKLVMLAAIRRIMQPGCKFEIMLCLVGGQGAGKSTFFRFLALKDEWFTDDLRRLDDDNVYRKLQGHWIVEMAEMLAQANAKSIEEIKSFLSRQKETYKIPYETHPEDRPRQCIFCGTSNNLKFLPMDRTGNRRFAPVLIHPEAAATHILANEKESRAYFGQMWAEAMEIYRSGNWELKLSDEMEKYVKELQKDFMPEDTKAGQVEAFLEKYEEAHVCTKCYSAKLWNMQRLKIFRHGCPEKLGRLWTAWMAGLPEKHTVLKVRAGSVHGYGLKNVNRVCQRIGRASLKYRSKWKYPLIDVNKETEYRNAVDSINTAKSRVSGNCQQCQRRF